MGGWAIAQSPIMRTTVTEERLAKRGYQSFTKYYEQLSMVHEPPYTRPVRTVV